VSGSERARDAIWALVPVKPLREGKSRLKTLPLPQRIALQRAMLADVLTALTRARELDGVAVVTRDAAVAALAMEHGATVIDEPGSSAGLNAALVHAAKDLCARGARCVLVVPADLPLLEATEIDALVAQARLSPSTFVIPSHDQAGTNALLIGLDPPPVFLFGEDSFRRHLEPKHQHRVVPWPAASFALDIDTPQDLAALREAVSNRTAGPIAERTMAWIKAQHLCTEAGGE
jgi:2-phospho-L-lactate guanylyltransferase